MFFAKTDVVGFVEFIIRIITNGEPIMIVDLMVQGICVLGSVVLFCGLTYALFFSCDTDKSNSGARMLGVVGSTLIIFFSFIFNAGIRLKKDQELTI